MLSLQNAGKRFGPRILFLEANWLIRAKERTALVGANGTGKSTLMKVLAGLETLDYGVLQQTKGMSIGYLPQEGLRLTGRTVFDECLTVFDELREMEREVERLSGQLAELDHASAEYETVAERYSMLQERFHALDGYALDAQVGTVLTGLGFGKEVDMISLAHDIGFFTCVYVFNPDESRAMAAAGADAIIAHMGLTVGGSIGLDRTDAMSLERAPAAVQGGHHQFGLPQRIGRSSRAAS